MSKKTATMMARDSQKEESPETMRNSPEFINNASAMLPVEMWLEIFQYLEYRDFLNAKITSKHLNAIATRVAKTKYKWYERCRRKVPEIHWCKILESTQHPVKDQIDCKNLHNEKEYATIWKFLYSTWIGWSTMMDKEPCLRVLPYFNDPDEDEDEENEYCPKLLPVDNIIVMKHQDQKGICFYDILELAAESIYSIPRPYSGLYAVSKKGTDLTATIGTRPTYESREIVEKWNIKSQELIHSTSIKQPELLFICESFGYVCTITIYSERERDFCRVEIRQEASDGNLKYISFQLVDDDEVTDVQAHGDTLMLLITEKSDGPIIKLTTISIRECQLKETHETSINNRAFSETFFLFHPCVVAYSDYDDQDSVLGFSVSGRDWKWYNTTRDLNLEAIIFSNTVLYEGGVLALLMETGKVVLIYVADPNDLDSKLETLPSTTISLNWNDMLAVPRDNGWSVHDVDYVTMCFTKYRSKIYLIIALSQIAIILRYRYNSHHGDGPEMY